MSSKGTVTPARRIATTVLLTALARLLAVALAYADELRRVEAIRASSRIVDATAPEFAERLARAIALSAPVRLIGADGGGRALLFRPERRYRPLRLLLGQLARHPAAARRLTTPGERDPLQRLLGVRVT